jgi:kynurenine formamidase
MCLPQTLQTVRALDDESPAARPTRRDALLGAGALGGAALLARPGQALAGTRRRTRVQDLTHRFRAGFPVFTGDVPARRTIRSFAADGFYAQEWTFGEHSGTHVDAPGHFVQGRRLVHELGARELVAPAAVVDVSERAERDPDTAVTVADLRRYERRHGRIPAGALVLMHSGWGRRIGDPTAFLNADASGTYHFPGFGEDAVEWLVERRRPIGIGVDTLSLDPGASTTFGVHRRWLGTDRYGIENVANLDRIPPRGARVTVGVVPWDQGSGGPARVLAEH